jgi:hypothetical protein
MKRAVPLTMILIGVLLIIGTLGWVTYEKSINSPATLVLPQQLAGLPLSSKMDGPQAVADFSNLHGKQFPLVSGAVGIYGNQQATIWVAGAIIDLMAARMVADMHDKIAAGNSPFTPVGEYKDNKRTIYMLEGMGQNHFYFQSKNLVIWLAANADIADDTLQQLKEFYP